MKRNLTYLTLTLVLGLGISARAAITGQWDFNSSNLTATVGAPLEYYNGDITSNATTFTTATIGGKTAVVMAFPAATVEQGYIMTHNIAPNGGGSYVNQFTLIMDIMFPLASDGVYRSLWQTNPGNSNDGDLFVDPGDGIGISGEYSGAITPDTWHRVAFVFDLTLPTDSLKKFIDGVLVGSQTLSSGVDGRWSLDPTALLFTDNDGETAAGFVNSLQIHDVALTPSQIFALGVPTAEGLPTSVPVITNVTVTVTPTNQSNVVGMTGNHFTANAVGSGTLTYKWYRDGVAVAGQTNPVLRLTNVQLTDAGSYTVVVANGLQSATSSPPVVLTVSPAAPAYVTGQWDFNNGNLSPSVVGQPLQFFDSVVQADTSFGTTTSFGISDIAGQPANVMYCNPSTVLVSAWGGLIMTHGISPNGEGTNVNQYTVILDLLYPGTTSGFYRGLWQTNPWNTNDSDAFINGGNGIGISQQYDGTLTLDEWHRVVLAFDLTKREFGKYIDGTNVMTAAKGAVPFGPNDAQYLSASTNVLDGGSVDMRWSLGPTALLFADGGPADDPGEVQPVYVSSVQIRGARMTDAAIAALGTPTVNKIPGAILARRSGNSVIIDWTGNVLESASSVTGAWTVINGAAHPYVVTAPSGAQFFRVRQ